MLPVWPKAMGKKKKDKAPVRVVIIDTGVYGSRRGDGWLTGLETKRNREDLDDSPKNGFLDLAAGHGIRARHRSADCARGADRGVQEAGQRWTRS